MSCNGMASSSSSFFSPYYVIHMQTPHEEEHQLPAAVAALLHNTPCNSLEDLRGKLVTHIQAPRSLSFSGVENGDEMHADDDLSDDGMQTGEKKRRLTVEQVRTLEKNFEQGNKLEPERKMQLARALGLQPRQVAIWFQNRRARWKTKQLEKDYDVLKRQFEAMKSENEALRAQNQKLHAEVLVNSHLSSLVDKHCFFENDDPMMVSRTASFVVASSYLSPFMFLKAAIGILTSALDFYFVLHVRIIELELELAILLSFVLFLFFGENICFTSGGCIYNAQISALKGREAPELINLNKETEGSCSNRSENSSEINLDISRTSVTESPLNPHHSLPPPFVHSIRPADMDQQLLGSSSRPEMQSPKIETGATEGSFSTLLCGLEDQSASFWPWSDHHNFH
ncbi:hypothetical protein BHE74_00010373 [Ensete ventricosum]|nr:hypothetical protein GW17_00042022 [Ensete ventricosum]RWW81245.1 hypothetical protein BHE74_00010373 [Ensete ventricosum]